MDKTLVERRVYNGGQVKRGYRVSSIKLVKCNAGDKPVELVKVSNQVEYSSGCPLHRGGCFGHMCVTPTMNLLPPHSLSFRSGDIRTQYYIATSKAFGKSPEEYVEDLKKTNYGKWGHLRSIMSTPVSGSARLVSIPHDFSDPRVVFISPNLASKIIFCYPGTGGSGVRNSTYNEREVREGDYVILERAPSLSKFNNQPLKLMFWDKECIGIHPKVFSFFHGDYDGDEVHIYALGDPGSIEEAKAWRAPLDANLSMASEYTRQRFPHLFEDPSEGDMSSVSYTTLSFDEIASGLYALPTGNFTRNKESHMEMFRDRILSKPGTSTFLEDSIKGVKDIMRQQISQGTIGDMSRVARISAMCFYRGREGGTYVVSRRSRVLLNRFSSPSVGSPSVRCIMVLCQASQQAALDAHRVGSTEEVGIDLISNLLKGRCDQGWKTPCNTVYVLSNITQEEARERTSASWCYSTSRETVCIALDNIDDSYILNKVKGSYSPVVLSKLQEHRRRSACKLALNLVYNYYGLETEGDDIDDLVEALCYEVSLSTLPITTREGMMSRGLGWMETVMACDYTKTPALSGSFSSPESATSATMCANFSRLVGIS